MIKAAPAGFNNWEGLMSLIQRSFDYMDGRIDPPSSAHRLTVRSLQDRAMKETLLIAAENDKLIGCAFVQDQEDALYVGKLAIAPDAQRSGLGRAFMAKAETLARRDGISKLRLETRVELTENHAAFGRMGFVKVSETAHAGFDRPTSITMEKIIHP